MVRFPPPIPRRHVVVGKDVGRLVGAMPVPRNRVERSCPRGVDDVPRPGKARNWCHKLILVAILRLERFVGGRQAWRESGMVWFLTTIPYCTQ